MNSIFVKNLFYVHVELSLDMLKDDDDDDFVGFRSFRAVGIYGIDH